MTVVSEMTYTVSSGTLNSTILPPYMTVNKYYQNDDNDQWKHTKAVDAGGQSSRHGGRQVTGSGIGFV